MAATRWRFTATTVVLALTAASACSNSSTEIEATPEPVVTDPATDTAATGDMFVGRHEAVTVTISADAVTGPVNIIVTAANTPRPDELSEVPGAVVAHTGVDVNLTGGTLTGTADITFELPESFDHEQLVPIVAWETDDSDRWEILPTHIDHAAGTITATTEHFSFGWFGWVDPAELVEPIRAWVADLVFGRAGANHPTCGDERSPRDAGIDVISDSGDLVMWCFGHEDGRDVLKVTNNWRAAQQVSFRSNWQATGFTGAGINLQGLYDWLATITTTTLAGTTRLIPPGGTIVIETVDIPSDQWAVVAVEPSVGSWSWSGALIGVDVLMAIYGKLLKSDGLREQAEAALATAQLAKCFSETYGSDAAQAIWTDTTSDPQELFDTVVEALKFGLECGHQIIVDILEDAGTNPVITTAITVVGVAVGIGVGLIGAATAGARGLFDEVTALFDDSQLTSYGYAVALTRTSQQGQHDQQGPPTEFPWADDWTQTPQLGSEPAAGSGCGWETNYGNELPDGWWYGIIDDWDDTVGEGTFRLDCAFLGEAADDAYQLCLDETGDDDGVCGAYFHPDWGQMYPGRSPHPPIRLSAAPQVTHETQRVPVECGSLNDVAGLSRMPRWIHTSGGEIDFVFHICEFG